MEAATLGVIMENWILDILADPVTKKHAAPAQFKISEGVLDARVFMQHTLGFQTWNDGQQVYEVWDRSQGRYEACLREIEYDRPVYEHIRMEGRILDVGGGAGTVRQFLPDVEFVSIDPYIDCLKNLDPEKVRAYTALSQPLNFIAACAEFLPFVEGSFDWIHMRSMLDHVQSPDLSLLEARRVLKPSGRLVIGLYVEGGRSGRRRPIDVLKSFVRPILSLVLPRYRDHHVFHPTFSKLRSIVEDNGFTIVDVFWQPHWNDKVCYLTAAKS